MRDAILTPKVVIYIPHRRFKFHLQKMSFPQNHVYVSIVPDSIMKYFENPSYTTEHVPILFNFYKKIVINCIYKLHFLTVMELIDINYLLLFKCK